MQQTPAKELKAIRKEVKLSMQNFAAILKTKKATYQGYESGRRPAPTGIIDEARAQLQRTRKYWAEMDKRMDEELKGKQIMSEVTQ
jgi:transcriptional regulator with XRE-family HTH domain